MPSFDWDSAHNAYVKECVGCGEIFIGTTDQHESYLLFRKSFGKGGASNLDGLYTSCMLCYTSKANGYKITHQEKKDLYKKQDGKCAICKNPIAYQDARIDHCHETGRIRGLLHTPCNSQLGFYEKYKDNIEKYMQE